MCCYVHSDPTQLAEHMAKEHGVDNRPQGKWKCTQPDCTFVGHDVEKYDHMLLVHGVTVPRRVYRMKRM